MLSPNPSFFHKGRSGHASRLLDIPPFPELYQLGQKKNHIVGSIPYCWTYPCAWPSSKPTPVDLLLIRSICFSYLGSFNTFFSYTYQTHTSTNSKIFTSKYDTFVFVSGITTQASNTGGLLLFGRNLAFPRQQSHNSMLPTQPTLSKIYLRPIVTRKQFCVDWLFSNASFIIQS